ncbi:NADPH-dependent FMN reductase [Solicola gregarius]|uniref:NAD(P)H-dependent oxidoreductase n=1 Tax=Solicola gregarius TaxID=2908642 RepID=A0AA46TK37_9ACTN|nr:NAD(P)H-dependent oxidoreductase [Solicola gregarius]UYM06349.1 NAD(P)H-dependent oxidoreductase [Solicola gregarius]
MRPATDDREVRAVGNRPSHPEAPSDGPLRIGVIVGSTRPGRRAPAVAHWTAQVAIQHLGEAVEVQVLDLARFALPLLDENVPAALGEYERPHTRRWAQAVGACDGFVFVTPEYNHSLPAALKNALDFVYAEWHNKAAGIVGYGVDGGVRAVEHLRQVLAELQVADVRTAVTLVLPEDFTGDGLSPRAFQAERVRRVADEVLTWSRALHSLRAR